MKYNKKRVVQRTLTILLILSMMSFFILYYSYSKDAKNSIQYLKKSSNNDLITFQWIINEYLNEVYSDLLILQELFDYEKCLTDNKIKGEITNHYFAIISSKTIYDQLRFLDTKGNELIRVNFNNGNPEIVKEKLLQNKSHRYYFKEILNLKENCIYASPLDLNIENNTGITPFLYKYSV